LYGLGGRKGLLKFLRLRHATRPAAD
jgi:hypothetical protein